MNKVIECGRLTKDPEVRYSQGSNATATAKFTLAVDRKIKKDNEPTADFISCVAFGKTAEFIEKYVKKGTKLICVGEIRTGSYTNNEGKKVYTTDVVVNECEFAESKASGQQNTAKADDGFNMDFTEDELDLPFGPITR